ncbi:MAG: hypothetical protein ACR2GQ_07195 [Gemmatimonadota bacterium]
MQQFVAELKQRQVFRVAAVYGVVGFGVIEAADVMFPRMALPEWTVVLVVWLILLGFPLALALAWAFDATPDGVRRAPRTPVASPTPGSPDAITTPPARRRWPMVLAGVIGGALVVGSAWFTLTDRAATPFTRSSPSASDPDAPVTVAVLAASGPDLDRIGEGLAGLLARGLDNVTGLRSAPENLVMRGWLARDPAAPDSAAALEVARSVNSAAAVVMSSTSVGSQLRLYARVYPVADSKLTGGSVQVEGDNTDLIRLVDELAVKLVAKLTPGDAGESAAIAGQSTRSLPAMRAFLLGEQAMRRSDHLGAVSHLREAVAHDTAFGLAWYQLSRAYGWSGQLDSSWVAGGRAARHASAMPARERLIVESYANLSVGGGRLGRLEDAVRRSPDDWELVWVLSELYLHDGWRAGIGPRTADSVRARAAELSPGDADLLNHGIDLALGFYRDSAQAAELIDGWESVAGRRDQGHRLIMRMVFGEDSPAWLSELDRIPAADFTGFPYPLAHPLSTSARIRINEAMADRQTLFGRLEPAFFTGITRGRLGAAFAAFPDTAVIAADAPQSRACFAYMLNLAGVDLTGTEAGSWLAGSGEAADSEVDARRESLLCRGGQAVDEERWTDAEAAIATLSALRGRAGVVDDSTDAANAPEAAAAASALRTYLRWKRGETEVRPIPLAVRANIGYGESWPIRWWTGQMLRQAGRSEEALEVFESFWFPAWLPAFLERADIAAELGRTDEARDLYQVVLTSWSDADAQFQPLVERARAGLARLD